MICVLLPRLLHSVTMERISFLRAVVLVSILVFMQGSSAVIPVFVEKGKDVLLEVTDNVVLKETDTMLWRFSQAINLVRFTPTTKPVIFSGRVSVKNFSVILKNLTSADSGVYKAIVSGAKERTIAEYNVTVQDPVSPVELNVDSVSNSSCNINATCKTVDSHISGSFRCVNKICHQDGEEQSKTTNSGASLRIYLSNAWIFCNHSNQVSWTENMTEIQPLCEQFNGDPHTNNIAIWIVIVVIIIVVVVTAIVAVICLRRNRRQYHTKNTENTIYATPQVETTQTQHEISPNDASCASPTSTYSLVGLHPRPTETRDNPLPESLYATVDKPAKVEKPVRPCKNLQEL